MYKIKSFILCSGVKVSHDEARLCTLNPNLVAEVANLENILWFEHPTRVKDLN